MHVQYIYIAALVSICVLLGTSYFALRSVREEDSDEMDTGVGLRLMNAIEGDNSAKEPSWWESTAALDWRQREEPEETEQEPVLQAVSFVGNSAIELDPWPAMETAKQPVMHSVMSTTMEQEREWKSMDEEDTESTRNWWEDAAPLQWSKNEELEIPKPIQEFALEPATEWNPTPEPEWNIDQYLKPAAAQAEEPAMEPMVEQIEEPIEQKTWEPVMQEAREPVMEQVWEPAAEEVWEPVAQQVWKPVVERIAPPVMQPMSAMQPMFAQGFTTDHYEYEGEHRRGKQPAYALMLQGMVVGAVIVLLAQTQKRLVS